jgi:hypothetical protein
VADAPGNATRQFVARLVREDVLVRDPLVDHVVAGERPMIRARSVQPRVAAATGLTQGAIRRSSAPSGGDPPR